MFQQFNMLFFLQLPNRGDRFVNLQSAHNVQYGNIVIELVIRFKRFSVIDTIPKKIIENLRKVHDLSNVVSSGFNVEIALLFGGIESLDFSSFHTAHGDQELVVVAFSGFQ